VLRATFIERNILRIHGTLQNPVILRTFTGVLAAVTVVLTKMKGTVEPLGFGEGGERK
jgi:hypothetical protein